MKTILALVDFSHVTAKVLAQAQALAKAFHAKVIIMHVLKPERVVIDLGLASPTVSRPPREEVVEAGQAKLLELRDSLAAAGIDVTTQQMPDFSVEKILDESRKLAADVIIVGSHHHSALYNLFVGSFTNDLLKLASCPVLVVPVSEDLP
jgi:nucleotide-binding universal stress UspA family protein